MDNKIVLSKVRINGKLRRQCGKSRSGALGLLVVLRKAFASSNHLCSVFICTSVALEYCRFELVRDGSRPKSILF